MKIGDHFKFNNSEYLDEEIYKMVGTPDDHNILGEQVTGKDAGAMALFQPQFISPTKKPQ